MNNQKLISFGFAFVAIILMNVFHPSGFNMVRVLIAFGVYLALNYLFSKLISQIRR